MQKQSQNQYLFDEFELDTNYRRLVRDGEPVSLNAKTFELLSFLVKNNGRTLSKDEILDAVWPGQFVEESNLSVQISALRKALDDKIESPRFLVTIPGKGYKFIADVRSVSAESAFPDQRDSGVVVPKNHENEFETDALKHGIAADETGTQHKPIRSRKTRTLLFLSALLVGICLVVGFTGYWIYKETGEPKKDDSPPGRLTISRITDGKIRSCPSISPDGRFVAFAENFGTGSGSLYLHQTDTNTTIQLLEPGERTFGCTNFSTDGSFIYYVVYEKGKPDSALYRIPVLGGFPRQILTNLDKCFTISPNGNQVAFVRDHPEDQRAELIIARIDDGAEKVLLTRSYDESKFFLGLAWSPDGNSIAIAVNPEPRKSDWGVTIFSVDSKNGSVRRMTNEMFAEIGKISWTSDGLSLGFVARRHWKSNKLYLMDHASGVVRRITDDLESYGNYGMSFTADSGTLVANITDIKSDIWKVTASGEDFKPIRVTRGRNDGAYGISSFSANRIAYVGRASNSFEIMTINEDGSDEKILTTDAFNQHDLVASPDGRYLIFASDQVGESQVFRMNAENATDITQLTFGKSLNDRPDVSPDGETVIFGSSTRSFGTVWRVPVIGGKSEQLTDYECFSPVFSPDGNTFACVLPDESLSKRSSIAIVAKDGGTPIKTFPVVPFRWRYTIRWTPDGKAITFEDSKNGVSNLWQQPLSGKQPRQITNFADGVIRNFGYSSDGKNLLVSRGESFVDVVLIKNFR